LKARGKGRSMPLCGVRMDCKGIGAVLKSENATAFTENG
jgi:hypothetical protein